MKSKKETFTSILEAFAYRYDVRTVFEDFLTMSMCAVTQNPLTGISHYEDLYLETIAKYKNDQLRFQFPELFAALVLEMDERKDDSRGNDVLGEFFELSFSKKNSGQFFTPWHVCEMMSELAISTKCTDAANILRIADPTCGSGRMLLASAKHMGPQHEYYGIDIDHTCVKMTALNMFLNGIFHAEVMWADALSPDDFRTSYAISLLPLGIFRIEDREQSKLWLLHQSTFKRKDIVPKPASQLPLF